VGGLVSPVGGFCTPLGGPLHLLNCREMWLRRTHPGNCARKYWSDARLARDRLSLIDRSPEAWFSAAVESPARARKSREEWMLFIVRLRTMFTGIEGGRTAGLSNICPARHRASASDT
jgi:hypothetical protein